MNNIPSTPENAAPLTLPTFAAGSVWLVGAGPGDPGLLTLLALHALRSADIIVYDALVDRRILTLANPKAVLNAAGKRGGRPSAKQQDISQRLIAEARKGKRVLRLKGGDPFVFGRGGEEALALAAAQIPFRLVPGITAAIGGLAYAGVPVTHRGLNTAVTFLTAHDKDGDLPDDFDWEAMVKGSPLLVVYMPTRNLGRLAQRLIEAGRPADEPALLLSKATTPDQKAVATTLKNCVADAAKAGAEPPAIFAIGKSVALREQLDWYRDVLINSEKETAS
ncbi:MAG: uroporphyrinogen-III C-methyltransferase [Rhodospirillaceae bacterium]|nr:MAG: uroporphyrinogen-III C-methyltransferase [Rhodospirillaceae bacterium]